MVKEYTATGKTVEEAIEAGCAAIGEAREDVQFEILELPKKTFLGLKTIPAKVRVYLEVEEAPVQAQKPGPAPRRQEAPKAPRAPKQEQPRAAKPAPPAPQEPQQPQAPAPLEKEELTLVAEPAGKAKVAADYLSDILTGMGVSPEMDVYLGESRVVLRLKGESLGVIIGRRGETLDALQHLCGLAANRAEGDYIRVTIDSGNYREKRERTLQALARRLAAQAIRKGRSCTLEPMNPYERRIIHAAVSEIEGVTSSSIGEEPNRRVVIHPLNTKPYPPREGGRGPRSGRGGRDNRDGGRGRGRGGRDRRERSSAVKGPVERTGPAPTEGKDQPLYGKIDLD